MIKKQTFFAALAVSCLLAYPGLSSAAGFPERTITFVAPFTAGSAPDVFTRAMAQEVSKVAGVPVIVENRPGASSVIAAQAVATAKPDGYTVLISGNVAFTGNPHVLKNMPYDPVNGFVPLTTLSKGPMYLYVNPQKIKAKTVNEFVQELKKDPKKYTYGYTSITTRLPMEMLTQSAGVSVEGAPYKSGNSMLPDLLSGIIDFMFTDYSAWTYVDAGKLKSIGVTDSTRSPFAPNLPTFTESGVKNVELTFWLAAYFPAKAALPVVEKMYSLLVQAVKTPTVQAAMKNSGTFEFIQPLGELENFQNKERAQWGTVIKTAGIQPQ